MRDEGCVNDFLTKLTAKFVVICRATCVCVCVIKISKILLPWRASLQDVAFTRLAFSLPKFHFTVTRKALSWRLNAECHLILPTFMTGICIYRMSAYCRNLKSCGVPDAKFASAVVHIGPGRVSFYTL